MRSHIARRKSAGTGLPGSATYPAIPHMARPVPPDCLNYSRLVALSLFYRPHGTAASAGPATGPPELQGIGGSTVCSRSPCYNDREHVGPGRNTSSNEDFVRGPE